ncbi:hypothetical protein [uncultured Parasphingorhabdus sp.]|uniref:hypothetical protein n=1 Tax=uncultured Parasphingorhabdus sp. TaxID=2709694 RepID=UPI0030D76580|tara:strand:+ start:60342 stop:60587 length:246 start_codon:yes stop_codon:yes gene_type:complete
MAHVNARYPTWKHILWVLVERRRLAFSDIYRPGATGRGKMYLNIRVLRVISISMFTVKSKSRLKLTPVTKANRKVRKIRFD